MVTKQLSYTQLLVHRWSEIIKRWTEVRNQWKEDYRKVDALTQQTKYNDGVLGGYDDVWDSIH